MKPILEINNLTKTFGNFIALNKISFSLQKGEIIGLIGENGAGKTVLSEIIVGITKKTSGEIKYNFSYKKTFKEKVGMQFQDSSYPSGLTVKDLISFARNLHHINISQKKLKNLLQTFHMGSFYRRKAKSLSGGQRQKLNILLSVLHKPKFIILDELTTGLDISAREDIISFTKNLLKTQNISAILISHHMHEIKSLCKDVIVLSKGNMVAKNSIINIEKKHKSLNDYVKKFISTSIENYQENKEKKQYNWITKFKNYKIKKGKNNESNL